MFREPSRLHKARVCAFHDNNARIVAQPPVQLAVAHVDGIDLFCAVLQHTIRESARRSADVERNRPCKGDAELAHRLIQLQTAAAHKRDRVFLNRKHGIGGYIVAGLLHPYS